MKKDRLMKRLSIGVASLALVAPLVLGGVQSNPVHADKIGGMYVPHSEVVRAKEETNASRHNKASVAEAKRDDRSADEADDSGEVAMIKLDPSQALTVQHDTPFYRHHKALVNHAQGLFTTDKYGNYKLKPQYRYTKHGNIVRRHRSHARRAERVSRSSHRSHARKHTVRKHVRRASHRRHGGRVSVAQTLASMKKSDDNTPASVKAENKRHSEELQAVEDKNEIKLVKNDPDEAYMDAEDADQLSPAVRKVVEVVYPRDVRKGLEPQLNGRYLHRYHARKHGRTKKHVARKQKHVARKHIARKHNNRKHHAKKNIKRSRHNKRGVEK